MQHQHTDAGALDGGEEGVVVQQRDLAARAAEALHAVRARGEQQQARRAVVADLRQIDRQLFSFRAALAGVHVPGAPGAARLSRGEELAARLGVALGEMDSCVHGSRSSSFSAFAFQR